MEYKNFCQQLLYRFFGGVTLIVSTVALGEPYAGIDLQQKGFTFAKNYGKEVFAPRSLQNNVYIGYRLNEYFGLEGGYQSTHNEVKTTHILAGQFVLGQWFAPDGTLAPLSFYLVSQTKVRMQGPHFNVAGYLPLYRDKIELMAAVGITFLTVKLMYRQLSGMNGREPLAGYGPPDVADSTNHFSCTRVIPRLSLGIQHALSESLGVRASMVYEFTSRFKSMASKDPQNPPSVLLPGNGDLRATLRNTITYGLGLYLKF